MTKSAPRTRALALWLPSKVSTEVARRCRTRCDKRHSGVNCKLVQMRLAVCGQGAGCGEKWLLHLPSEQLVHLGCPSACSTAWTGRRAPERGSSSSAQKCLSFIFSALDFSWIDRLGQLGILITADWVHPYPPLGAGGRGTTLGTIIQPVLHCELGLATAPAEMR